MPEEQFTTPQPVRLEVTVPAGDVRISTVDGEQSTVVLDGAEKLLDSMSVSLRGERLVIEQRRKSLFGFVGRFGESLHVTARVPHGSSVELRTASGDATVDGSFSAVEMRSASGNVTVAGEVQGDVSVKSVSGDVRLPRVAGDLTVQTVSGGVEAQAVDGSASVKSVSADVRLGSLREGNVSIQSVSGDVELGIASGTSVDVDASSASGELSSEVPLSQSPTTGEGPKVVIRGHTVSGDFRVFRAA